MFATEEDTMEITTDLKAAADALQLAADFSVANPTTPLRDNPHVKPSDKAHRKATGSVRTLWICPPCGRVMPRITDDLHTVCCGSATVDLH